MQLNRWLNIVGAILTITLLVLALVWERRRSAKIATDYIRHLEQDLADVVHVNTEASGD